MAEENEENDFSPDFREYMERELYRSSPVLGFLREERGWVFWDRRDGYPDLTRRNYDSLNLDPKLRIRLKIRDALCELMIPDTRFMQNILQFWAPIKTVEGRTYLTVQNQPFAIGSSLCNSVHLFFQHRTSICNLLCDAHAEEQLGLPAHVFLHKLPKSAPYPSYNTPDLASSHRIKATWALPVFEKNCSACVGVLEIASCFLMCGSWDSGSSLPRMRKNFQEFGLSCPDEPVELQLGLPYQPSATGCIPSLEHLKDGRVMLQLGYQPSVHTITNGSKAQNSNSPSLVSYTLSDPSHDSLPNDTDPYHDSMPNEVDMMQVDSSDQASVHPSNSLEDQEQSMELNSDDQASAIVGTVTVRAKVENYYTLKFDLSSIPRLVELQHEVDKRKINPRAYDIFCTDEGEKPIVCDNDLQQWIYKPRSLDDTSIRVTLRPKQPSPP